MCSGSGAEWGPRGHAPGLLASEAAQALTARAQRGIGAMGGLASRSEGVPRSGQAGAMRATCEQRLLSGAWLVHAGVGGHDSLGICYNKTDHSPWRWGLLAASWADSRGQWHRSWGGSAGN